MDDHGRKQILSGKSKPSSPFRPENICPILTSLPQWTGWMWHNKKGHWTKPPINVKSRQMCSITDSANWFEFPQAVQSFRRDIIPGVGVVLGETPLGWLCGVDFDGVRDKQTGEIDEDVLEIIRQLDSYTEVSPSGTGLKVLFLADEKPASGVRDRYEVYTGGRYFAITGLVHPGVSRTLEDRTDRAIELFGKASVRISRERAEGMHAIGDFDIWAWIDEFEVAYKEIQGYDGVLDESQGEYRIMLEHCPFNPEHDRAAIIVNTMGRPGFKCFHHSCATYHWREFRTKTEQDYLLGELDELPIDYKPPQVQVTVPLSEAVLQPPGLMSDIISFTLANAPYPQPLFALSGAIGFMSVLCGRLVRDPTNIRSNIYLMNVGPTGCGKSAPQTTNRILSAAVDLPSLASSDWPTSEAGLLQALHVLPSRLFQPDEMGKLIEQIASGRSIGTHGVLVAKAFMQAYSLSHTTYASQNYANERDNRIIHWPNASIVGNTTPGLFHSLNSTFMTDGFLGRFLIFEVSTLKREINRTPGMLEPSADLLHEIRSWSMRLVPEDRAADPGCRTIPYAIGIADRLYEYQDHCDKEMLKVGIEDPRYALWTRVPENVKKLALIYTCSCRRSEIGPDAVNWAIDLVEHLLENFMRFADEKIVDSEFQMQCMDVIRAIRSCYREEYQGAKWHEVLRRSRMKASLFREIIRTLHETEQILVSKGDKEKNNKTPRVLNVADVDRQ